MRNPPFPDPRQLKALRDLEQALAFQRQGRLDDADKSFARIIKRNPDYFDALHLYGVFKFYQKELNEAVRLVSKATKIDPRAPDALNTLGVVLGALGRHREALTKFESALALVPNHVPALSNRCISLNELGRHDEAMQSSDRAIALDSNHAEAYVGRGSCLLKFRKYPEAVGAYERALQLNPALAGAWLGLGQAFDKLKRHGEAALSYERVLAIDPQHPFTKGLLLHQKMLCCDWQGLAELRAQIEKDIADSKTSAEPFGYQAVATSPRNLQRCAELYTAHKYPRSLNPLWRGERYDHPKIRLGYLSGEFRNHVVALLMAELFERHDKNRFELFAYDNGFDDGSQSRRRIHAAFDHVVDISGLDNLQAAEKIKEDEIDILVNLNGYFGEERTAIFSSKPAPVQVNYLGYTATMGADYIDYIIADRYVIPPDQQAFYTEKVVYLPDTYQANDSKRPAAQAALTRTSLGLPETGFVFCCFNNVFKITPEVFALWMRLLRQVPGSVLWLTQNNQAVSRNLKAEATRAGIEPERVVFAATAKYENYLANYRAADLFLDTLPFNAGATASDALWAGLPVLTCSGTPFTGRMAGSLLRAIGLPELITKTPEDYEALAIRLAGDPALLASLKAKLERDRDTCPLFDSVRFTRHLEVAYTTMVERSRRGERPAACAVEA